MIYTEYTKLTNCILHVVGNKGNDEGVFLSGQEIVLNDETTMTLQKYLLGQVTSDGYSGFWHESQLELNEVYSFVKRIFEENSAFEEMSANIAKHLYACSTHPKIKSGELCVVYFKNIIVDTVTCDAVGLFKSENKDTFLRVVMNEGQSSIMSETGININKLDKAAIIFNTEQETGYWVTVIDRTNKATEAKYWTEDFLKVKPRQNSYNQTENLIAMTREFVAHMPTSDFKSEKAYIINRSNEAVKQPVVNLAEYAEEVFQDKEVAKSFSDYTRERSAEKGCIIDDRIEVSSQAVKSKIRTNLSVLKLDGNFDINIHGGEDLIEKGYDEERGLKYYKLYFSKEK
jgi:hypothetical protein